MTDPITLPDDVLMARVAALAARSRETTAELVAHLVELERRGLHLACGFSSLFGYCRRVLHCSESASFDRMRAAHAARRFPVVLAMLATGALHLTAVRLLAPHLRDEDHLALLGGAIRKSGREVRALLARWFPERDVPASVRRLPSRKANASVASPPRKGTDREVEAPPSATDETPEESPATVGTAQPATSRPVSTSAAAPRPPREPVRPLAIGRYEFRFTGDDETEALLREARELLSHSRPEIAAIFKRGLQLVVAEARRRRSRPPAARARARTSPRDRATSPPPSSARCGNGTAANAPSRAGTVGAARSADTSSTTT